jgi:hypothetical protein
VKFKKEAFMVDSNFNLIHIQSIKYKNITIDHGIKKFMELYKNWMNLGGGQFLLAQGTLLSIFHGLINTGLAEYVTASGRHRIFLAKRIKTNGTRETRFTLDISFTSTRAFL